MKIQTPEIILQAESYVGIRAGIASLADVLKGSSYRATRLDESRVVGWPQEARTVLVLGLHHPEKNPRLDWWERGDTWGNRRLRELSELLKKWLREKYELKAHPLPYHVEKGGLFLKDAAVISGIGIIGRNNLLVNPEWGPRIRLRSILLEGDWQSTRPLEGFSPCETCEGYCQKACPVNAFSGGRYSRPVCRRQIETDEENKLAAGEIDVNGKRHLVINFCRACEWSCPVGA